MSADPIRSTNRLRSAASIDGNDSAASATFRTNVSSSGRAAQRPACSARLHLSFFARRSFVSDQWNEADVRDILAAVLIFSKRA